MNIFLLIIALTLCRTMAYWSPPMIASYFAAKNVHFIDAILCNSKDSSSILKYFAVNAKTSGFLRIVSELKFDTSDGVIRTGIFVDGSCSDNQELLFSIQDDRLFTNRIAWLIWDQGDLLSLPSVELPILAFSDVCVVTENGLFKLFKATQTLLTTIHSAGHWDNETGEVSLGSLHIPIDFKNSVLKGAIFFYQDVYDRHRLIEQLTDDTFKPGVDVSNRFVFGNSLFLSYIYNYKLELVVADNWGERRSNGTWTGLLGMLQTGEADVTVTPMLPLSQRMEISLPTLPILPYWMAVIFKQPRALGTYRAMILELSPGAWACVGGLVVIGAIVFSFTQEHEPDPDPTYDSDGTIAMGLVQTVGIIANQGLCLMPKGTSSRIACVSLLTVGLLISTYYNAATMTALLSESPPLVKDLKQLIDSKIPLTGVDAAYVHNIKARSRVFREVMTKRMDMGIKVYSLDDGVKTIVNGSAFLGEYFVLFQAINSQLKSDTICDLTVFNTGFYTTTLSFTKNCTHLREMYMRGLLRVLENGLSRKERRRWIAERPLCTRVIEFIHVQLEAVSVAFGVYCSGIIFSITLFIFEIALSRRQRLLNNAKDELENKEIPLKSDERFVVESYTISPELRTPRNKEHKIPKVVINKFK